jgi:hypothetical protein
MRTLPPVLSIAVAIALCALAPAAARASGCASVPVGETFAPWLDPSWYQAAANAGFEAGASGWSLTGGAATVTGNEPFYVGSATDHAALALPADSSATTAPVCIGVEHPTIRLFARNTGSAVSRLNVSVVFSGLDGQPITLLIGQVVAGPSWAPTPVVPILINLLSLLGGQQVSFRFAPADSLGSWRIDDVYIDPYGKR